MSDTACEALDSWWDAVCSLPEGHDGPHDDGQGHHWVDLWGGTSERVGGT